MVVLSQLSRLILTDSRLRENGTYISVSLTAFQVSSKDEDFLDLSVDVEQNTSITHCLR